MKPLRERKSYLVENPFDAVLKDDVRECVKKAQQTVFSVRTDMKTCNKCGSQPILLSARLLSDRDWCKDCEWEYWVGV